MIDSALPLTPPTFPSTEVSDAHQSQPDADGRLGIKGVGDAATEDQEKRKQSLG